ncbi:Uncharacterized conserved protein, DUF2147 family [Filomicrobium insigne]|uniref:Uncharacterized conserved protein, DUF2147 family n=1 Tax=Filomicrobium insigne TaxID=418854 RepID=A0A1H0PUP9_9HYPH|nr:DUF2147 domain-containing protein [Filomicrobium insigne]SDP08286.1 Uncharacterized conserved protein, DUF2147 family [Filomicrobium insigne]
MKFSAQKLALVTLCAATGGLASVPAYSAGAPLGVWVDEEGRGAVEVRECGARLCGYVVWVRDRKDRHGCGRQLMGDVVEVASGWDNGWIASPDDGTKYSVALEPVNRSTMKVIGYSGSKFFSKTMIWRRAPNNIERCDKPAAEVITASATPKVAPKKEPVWTGPRDAPAPQRKPLVVAAMSEPAIVAPAPTLAQRPRPLPQAMGLGRGTDDIVVVRTRVASAAETGTSPDTRADAALNDNDCGLRAPFFALFGASTCGKK